MNGAQLSTVPSNPPNQGSAGKKDPLQVHITVSTDPELDKKLDAIRGIMGEQSLRPCIDEQRKTVVLYGAKTIELHLSSKDTDTSATTRLFSLRRTPKNIALLKAIAAAPELLQQLKNAKRHLEHMAAFISKEYKGYSFESLGEDMPGIDAAIAKAGGAA